MTTKSKLNPLTLIIIVAIVLFIAAAIWKTTHVDNAEEVYVPVVKDSQPIKKKKREVIEDTYNVEIDEQALTREEHKKGVAKALSMGMLYNTPEKIMDAIIRLQESGDTKRADEMIEILLERFPDYEMKE